MIIGRIAYAASPSQEDFRIFESTAALNAYLATPQAKAGQGFKMRNSSSEKYKSYTIQEGAGGTLTYTPSGAGDYVALPNQDFPVVGDEDINYYKYNATKEIYEHYRYKNGEYIIVGGDTYSQDDIDGMFDNLAYVADVEENATGIMFTFKDGSTTTIALDKQVVVADVDPHLDEENQQDGITIIYSDGDTKFIEITGGSGGGGSTSGAATITRITNAATQCIYSSKTCPISYTFAAVDSSGDPVGNGVATWYVGGVKKATSTALQGDNTFDIGQYLNTDINNVKLSITVDTGGESPITTSKTWTVNAIDMYVDWTYNDATINTDDTFKIRWTAYGNLQKTTHIIIDEGTQDQITRNISSPSNGKPQELTLNKLPHGNHLVKIYLTATVNEEQITSAPVYHDMIFGGGSSVIIASNFIQTTMTQYDTVRIPYVVYTPNSLTSSVTLSINGTIVSTSNNVDRTVQEWRYTPNDYGSKTLTITSGGVTRTFTITVSQLDIDNEEIGGYEFKLKASDLANNEALRNWSSNDVGITFSNNFDWNNGGIQAEEDANGNIRQYICVKAGTTATIDYELFGNDPKINGKNFKIIFKTTRARDYDAVFLDCVDGGIGISLGANGGTATSEQNSVSIQYSENMYTEFEYDIYPDSTYRYIQTYINGVVSSTDVYAANDNFTQTNKKKIVIGSTDCDVYIYLVKVYESYLTMDNHIENFIADAPNAQEMVARFNRNDIIKSGEISYEELADKNPDCRVHLWDIPRMTEGKKDYVEGCSYQQIYKAGSSRHQLTANNVTINIQGTSSVDYRDAGANTDGNFTEGFTDGDGNHIDTYMMTDDSIGVNYFNTKVNIASCENINNMCLAEWYNRFQPYQTLYGAKNSKSRDCMEHHIGVQFIKDQSHTLFPDDNYHMYAICNMGNSKKNGAVFHDAENPLECCFETKDNNSNYCMMLDPTFSVTDLDTEEYFEFRYPDNKSDRTSAMKNAFVNFVRWMASRNPAGATGNALASSETFEPYTFVGTGRGADALKGLTIMDYAYQKDANGKYVTDGNGDYVPVTYTHDTYEYRMAKMLSECEDHLIMDSIVYHYVFIEQHAMVDNVCKNTFWGTEDLVHWHLVKNYDNDTADGNNNTGKLTIPFGCEGMDTLGSGDVFNGKMNVYWQFVYGLYPARKKMWQNRETAGAWNAENYIAFAQEMQNAIPERVYNQDYWYKYLRLYEQRGNDTYIPMLEGGKKDEQRAVFVRNNFIYMASQYEGTGCMSKAITLRGYTPSISDEMTPAEKAVVEASIEAVPPQSVVQVMLYNKGYVVVKIADVVKRIRANKGVYYTVDFTAEAGNMNDTVINICSADNVRAVGNLAPLYIGNAFNNFSEATRLRSVTIGSTETGYCNNNLLKVTFGANEMLEELYIQNCPKANDSLDLSNCQALKTLDIRGSGFTGVEFAVGGLIEDAKLCAVSALTLRELHNLDDNGLSLESYNNLTTLRFENCPNISSYTLIGNLTNLVRLRLLGIDWDVYNTTLLNRLLGIYGLDELNHNTAHSVIGGLIDIIGGSAVKSSDLDMFYLAGATMNPALETTPEGTRSDHWAGLTVSYDSEYVVPAYKATYVNYNGATLYEAYVDYNELPPDPVDLGLIAAPTRPADEQYTYTYDGWDGIDSAMYAPRTITAQYTTTDQVYVVNWYSNGELLLSKNTSYGAEEEYTGSIPTNTSEETAGYYNVFKGWDKSTAFIKPYNGSSTINVNAVYARSPRPTAGKDLSEMTAAEIYAVVKSGTMSQYFSDKDYFDLVMGVDYDFTNVESHVLAQNHVLDGTTSKVINTDIYLCGENDKSFTLALDYTFASTATDDTLISCNDGDDKYGFRMKFSGSPTIEWGNTSQSVGYYTNSGEIRNYRGIVVIRHIAGTNTLSLYYSKPTDTKFSTTVTKTDLTRTTAATSVNPLTVGAVRFSSDGGYDYLAKGTIHWCKIWLDDLGDTAARKLASWVHETIRMEYCGTGRYRYYGGGSSYTNASFIANNLLNDGIYYMNSTNTNAGGWKDSLMRALVNGRLYDGLPQVWKSMLKQTRIYSTKGGGSSELQDPVYDYFYLPCLKEVDPSQTGAAYVGEGDSISWFVATNNHPQVVGSNTTMTANMTRIKFKGRIIPEDATYYVSNDDPYDTYPQITTGDVWIKANNSSNGFIFVEQDVIDTLGYVPASGYSNAKGGYLAAPNWWLRSPSTGYSYYFWIVNPNGGVYSSNFYASNAYGVCVGFSI